MRTLFDIPESVCYLNCAYMSPLAKPVVEAGMLGLRRKARPWEIEPADFFSESERARELFAELIGAAPGDVALAPSVSYAATLASRNVPLARGQSIVVLAEQFPSNVYPWTALAERIGARIRTVAAEPGQSWTDAVLGALDADDVAVAALPHVRWTDGALLDLDAISARCRLRGVSLVLDVTQSLGALPLDVSIIRPAFLVCAAYKWLLGPYSMAFLYADRDMQAGEPLEYSWITRRNADDFRGLVNYEIAYQDGARRYDMGEHSNFALMPMTIAALSLVLEWNPAVIQARLSEYTGDIERSVRELGLYVESVPARAGHFLGIEFAHGLPADALATFRSRGIHVSARGESVRVTPHLYNDDADKQRFIQALADITRG